MNAREIDRLLAEHLFGMTYLGPWAWRWDQQGPEHLAARRPRDGRAILLPYYSTTGDGMLLVVEAMRARGWMCEVYGYPQHQCIRLYPSQPDPLPPYRAVIALDREPWTRAEEYAATAPMAVALAALRARGVEVEKEEDCGSHS